MVTTGFCESCGGRVALNDDYSCVNDHSASEVHDIQGSEIAEPTWAVGSDGAAMRRPVHRSTLILVAGLLLVATIVGISVAGILAGASARETMASRTPLVQPLVTIASRGATSPARVASVPTSIPTHGANPVDTKNAMAPTIVSAQEYTLARRSSGLNVGDIVYFRARSGSRLIRRVVGLGGDSMSLSEGWTYRNGLAASEPFVKYNSARLTVGAILVPKGAVFVIGDNRDQLSSEFWGLVKVADVQGIVKP